MTSTCCPGLSWRIVIVTAPDCFTELELALRILFVPLLCAGAFQGTRNPVRYQRDGAMAAPRSPVARRTRTNQVEPKGVRQAGSTSALVITALPWSEGRHVVRL